MTVRSSLICTDCPARLRNELLRSTFYMRFIGAGAVFDPCRDYLLLFHSGIGPSTKYRRGQD